MSDWIYLTDKMKNGIRCEDCGDPAIALDGSGSYLCGDCLIIKYPEEGEQWMRE